jgi:hypothetical protein
MNAKVLESLKNYSASKKDIRVAPSEAQAKKYLSEFTQV